MALSDQATSGADAGLKAKVKVLMVAKALSVLKGGTVGTNPANAAELRAALLQGATAVWDSLAGSV